MKDKADNDHPEEREIEQGPSRLCNSADEKEHSTSGSQNREIEKQSELDSFRNDWINEVNKRRNNINRHDNQKSTSSLAQKFSSLRATRGSPTRKINKRSAAKIETSTKDSDRSDSIKPDLDESPLVIYAHAVYYERTGLLDDALVCYRKALKLDPRIDKTYHLLSLDEIDSIERKFNQDGSDEEEDGDENERSNFKFSRPFESQENQYPMMEFGSKNSISNDKSRNLDDCDDGYDRHPSSTRKLLGELLKSFGDNPFKRIPAPAENIDQIDNEDHGRIKDLNPRTEIITDRERGNKPEDERTGSRGDEERSGDVLEEIDPGELKFEIFDEALPIPISKIPIELLQSILIDQSIDRSKVHLTVNLIETFGRVSRLARILTLDQSVWRLICENVYLNDLFINHEGKKSFENSNIPQQQLLKRSSRLKFIENLCRSSHGNDWRRMYIEQPRMRFEGCFIALVRYTRLGESPNPWYTPTHFVTFFRYLRLFPNGICLSLSTTEEPNQVVRNLRLPNLNSTSKSNSANHPSSMNSNSSHNNIFSRGIQFGQWSLNDNFVRVFNLQNDFNHLFNNKDEQDEIRLNHNNTNNSRRNNNNNFANEVGGGQMKYRLEMHLKLQSTKRGKMNKLDLYRIITLNLNTGEELEVPLPKNEFGSKPFIFSRVFAYD